MPDDRETESPRHSFPLERGWVKHKLIRELAEGKKTHAVLAVEYGTSITSIGNFKRRHTTLVDQAKQDLADKFADLWIADKRNRLAELQADIDSMGDDPDPDLLKIKHAAMKQAAEELGQLPSRMGVSVQAATVTFQIDGIDLETLR